MTAWNRNFPTPMCQGMKNPRERRRRRTPASPIEHTRCESRQTRELPPIFPFRTPPLLLPKQHVHPLLRPAGLVCLALRRRRIAVADSRVDLLQFVVLLHPPLAVLLRGARRPRWPGWGCGRGQCRRRCYVLLVRPGLDDVPGASATDVGAAVAVTADDAVCGETPTKSVSQLPVLGSPRLDLTVP